MYNLIDEGITFWTEYGTAAYDSGRRRRRRDVRASNGGSERTLAVKMNARVRKKERKKERWGGGPMSSVRKEAGFLSFQMWAVSQSEIWIWI